MGHGQWPPCQGHRHLALVFLVRAVQRCHVLRVPVVIVMLLLLIFLLFGRAFGQLSEEENGRAIRFLQQQAIRRFPRQTYRSCEVPEPPQHGKLTVYRPGCLDPKTSEADCFLPSGSNISDGQILSFSCEEGFQLQGFSTDKTVSLCINGAWSQTFPQCQKLCKPLVSSSVELECVRGGETTPCNKYMHPGTLVTSRCRVNFTRAQDQSVLRCLDNGQWDQRLLQCVPSDISTCGVPIPEGATDQPQGVYPWMAVIFQKNSTGQWNQVCLGSLISNRIVLTGARCLVSKNGVLRPQDIQVGLGKYIRDFYKEQKNSVVLFARELVISPHYTGPPSFDVDDIGLVELSQEVELSSHIMPVCIDLTAPRLRLGAQGFVSGWNESQSEIILSGEMNYIDHDSCKKSRRVPLLVLTGDKFCADGNNGISVVGRGDRGGGFTVEKNGKHFVVGILSSKISGYQGSDGAAIFTDIANSKHKIWLQEQKGRLEENSPGINGNNQSPTSTTTRPPTKFTTAVRNGNNQSPTSTTTRPPIKFTTAVSGPVCTIPDPPKNRHFAQTRCLDSSAGCSTLPGERIPESELVTVTCSPGYFLVHGINIFASRALTSCTAGTWDPPIPDCVKLCPPLTSLTVEFTCWQGPDLVSCNKPMLPGTVVEYTCKEYHENNDITPNGMKCNPGGQWSRDELPRCTPKCGQSNLNSEVIKPTIFNGNFSSPGNFPWHAGIYHKGVRGWEAVCGGTLITTRVILTAAHCVTKKCITCSGPLAMATQEIMVGLGKNLRSWNATEENEVKRRIQEVWVHQFYVGSSLNYGHDIAVLRLESDVQVSSFVMPACVDYSLHHLKQLKSDRNIQGYVAGWGNTEECTSSGAICLTPSEKLKYARTSIINFTECLSITQTIRAMSISRLSTDKYCAGNGSESVVQQGDSGGGLTFVFNGLHYVYGVVSVKLKLEIGSTNYYNFGAFTSVTEHLSWLKAQLY